MASIVHTNQLIIMINLADLVNEAVKTVKTEQQAKIDAQMSADQRALKAATTRQQGLCNYIRQTFNVHNISVIGGTKDNDYVSTISLPIEVEAEPALNPTTFTIAIVKFHPSSAEWQYQLYLGQMMDYADSLDEIPGHFATLFKSFYENYLSLKEDTNGPSQPDTQPASSSEDG